MKQRIYSSIIIVAIMLVAFISRIFTPYVFDLFIGVTGIIACVEMAAMNVHANFRTLS